MREWGQFLIFQGVDWWRLFKCNYSDFL